MFNFRGPQDWQIVTVPQVTGEAGQTRLTLLNVPFRFSPSRNQMEEIENPDDQLSSIITEEIWRQSYCVPRQGFIRTTYHCRLCGEQLETSHRLQHSFQIAVIYNQVSSIRAILEAPAIQCPQCHVWNACELPKYPAEVELIEAVIEALEPPRPG